MARLLRSTAQSKLRPPTVVGASTQFRPLKLILVKASKADQDDYLRRGPKYKLRPPVVVGASTVFRPVQEKLVAVRTGVESIRHAPKYKLQPPSKLDPSIVFRAIKVDLVPPPKQARQPHYKLSPPPFILAPSVQFGPLKTTLSAVKTATDQIRHAPHSKLRPPAKIAASVVFGPLKLKLATAKPRPFATQFYTPLPPAVVSVGTTLYTRMLLGVGL